RDRRSWRDAAGVPDRARANPLRFRQRERKQSSRVRLAATSWEFSVIALAVHPHRLLEKQFFDSPAIDAADGDFQAGRFQFGADFGDTTELGEDVAADGVDARSIEIEPQSLA